MGSPNRILKTPGKTEAKICISSYFPEVLEWVGELKKLSLKKSKS
jgi:hypothetical protein